MKNFPCAKDLPVTKETRGLAKPSLKKLIEVWMIMELREALLEYDIRDYKEVVIKAPDEYYEQKEEFKKVFEALITPMGYKPVYTWDCGGEYSMVGVNWEK
jgi:hypothetical protein